MLKKGDISFYLIIFEKPACREIFSENNWMTHLIGLLNYDIAKLIMRELEDKSNDYTYIKDLLLKRFNLRAEKFRKRFVQHQRARESTWKDFIFDLRNYFKEWIAGLKVAEFYELEELIITDQLKSL